MISLISIILETGNNAHGPVELIPVLADFWHGGCVVLFLVSIFICLVSELSEWHTPRKKQAGIPHWGH